MWTSLRENKCAKASEIVILHITMNLASKAGWFFLSISEIHAFAPTFPSTSQQKSTEFRRLRCPLECKSLSSSTAFTSEHIITSLWSRGRNERVYPGVMFPSLQSRAGGEEWLSAVRSDRTGMLITPLREDGLRCNCFCEMEREASTLQIILTSLLPNATAGFTV